MSIEQFDKLTIGELRKMTADWNKIDWDKIKYPNKQKQKLPTAQDLINEIA